MIRQLEEDIAISKRWCIEYLWYVGPEKVVLFRSQLMSWSDAVELEENLAESDIDLKFHRTHVADS